MARTPEIIQRRCQSFYFCGSSPVSPPPPHPCCLSGSRIFWSFGRSRLPSGNMARRVPDSAYEREPHLFGPAALQYRYGTAVGNAKTPRDWEPELAHNVSDPYYADQYTKDVRDWAISTEVAEHRQGQILLVAPGGSARKLFDGLTTYEKQYVVDPEDPQNPGSSAHISAMEFILKVRESQFPVHEEARMLRAGLDFSSSCLGARNGRSNGFAGMTRWQRPTG